MLPVGGKILGLVLFTIPSVVGCYTLSLAGSIPHQRSLALLGYGKRRRGGYGQMVKFIHFFTPMMRGRWLYFFGQVKKKRLFYNYSSEDREVLHEKGTLEPAGAR
jgi:hypothetical protein